MSTSETIDAVLLVPVALIVLYVVLWWFGGLLALVPLGYKHMRYTRRGLCPKCHRPAQIKSVRVDQTYSSRASQLVCQCGTSSLPMGDRHAQDWAGF